MQTPNLWAPWRMDYLRQLAAGEAAPSEKNGCFLCDAAAVTPGTPEAQQRLVLRRDPHGLVLLNRFPYTNGHLLVACHDHCGDLSDLPSQQRHGLMELTEWASRLLRAAINPQGLNVGINLGRCAGAGLPGHLHIHVVPRWAGDTNFMDIVGHVRVIPQALEESYIHLKQVAEKMDAIKPA